MPVLSVLYEDNEFIAFDKPAGLLTIPSPKKEKNTLQSLANEQFGKDKNYNLFPCHRLDRDTSGIILFAKGKKNQKLMMDLFKDRKVTKHYVAFVRGKLPRKSGQLRSKVMDFNQLRHSGFLNKYARGPAKGKLAVSRFRVMDTKRKFSVVEVMPETGRTNQIRIQFAEIGHPLLGERLYALGRDFAIKFRRCALHSGSLAFTHPKSGKPVKIKSPLAPDMQDLLDRF